MSEKQVCLDRCSARPCPANSLLFTVYIHASRHGPCAFRLRRLAESGWPQWVLLATALSLFCRAHFGMWWSLFVAGARETSWLGAPKSTFRDRRKESELSHFVMQFSWQVQHFGHGGDRRRAQISLQVQ